MKPYSKVLSALRQVYFKGSEQTPDHRNDVVCTTDYSDLSLLAGEKCLTIICDRRIGGLWNCLRSDPCGGSFSGCVQKMRRLIHNLDNDEMESLLFPMSDNSFVLNIASDNINTGARSESSSSYQNFIEERLDVFYPIIKRYVELYANSSAVGLMCYHGSGTGLGVSFLSNLLYSDGFNCITEILQLPLQEDDSKPLTINCKGELEVFDYSTRFDSSSTISELYKEGDDSLYCALRNRLKERLASVDNLGMDSREKNTLDGGSRTYHNLLRPDYTPNSISSLKPDEVFVFGSNLQGRHSGGAARYAHTHFGAIWGLGIGMQGHSYAIPTMQGGVETVRPYVEEFIKFAKEHIEYFFYVTRIGCGIAGFNDSEIAPLFRDAIGVRNICLPKSFVVIIEGKPQDNLAPKELTTMMYGQIRTLIDLLKDLNKQEPIKDSDDAYKRLKELVERNVRYGDEFAIMAMRTIWSIMSRHESRGESVDIEEIEEEMFTFHDESFFHNNDAHSKIFYDYSAAKIIKYIKFLNEFRQYKNYEDVRKDLYSIQFSHCSENDPQYYFSFYKHLFYPIMHILEVEWENITQDGILNDKLLDDVVFGRYERLLNKYGLKETIRLAYGDIGYHPNLKGPAFSEEGRIYGPNYKIEGSLIEKGCSDFRRWPWSNTSFEMRFANSILEKDPKYVTIRNGLELLFVPATDYSLPVYSSLRGKLAFNSEHEKIEFIKSGGVMSC